MRGIKYLVSGTLVEQSVDAGLNQHRVSWATTLLRQELSVAPNRRVLRTTPKEYSAGGKTQLLSLAPFHTVNP